MKKISLIITLIFGALSVYAQGNASDTLSIDGVLNACINMRDAVAINDTFALHQSADELRLFNTIDFSGLRCKDDTITSLKGHLVFDENFADSLAINSDAYLRADEILRMSEELRGQNPDGSISTKTCFVKAHGSTKYTFRAKGYQELAVVAEAGGLVTMKIHVTNSAGLNERHDDTKDVDKGRPHRKTSFELPSNRSNTVELEIFNCGDNDISFVVISN